MATVTGKVLKPFTYKGDHLDIDDEVKMDVRHASRYEKLDYVKFDREASKKVEAAEEKATKSDNVPLKAAPKTK